MKKTICNMCGKKFDVWDDQESFGIHRDRIGYGSRHDGCVLDLDLCCNCMDTIIEMCRIMPTYGHDAVFVQA